VVRLYCGTAFTNATGRTARRLVREIATPVRIFAIDDLRLLRMQHQLAGRNPSSLV
jgi:hypothetical protein